MPAGTSGRKSLRQEMRSPFLKSLMCPYLHQLTSGWDDMPGAVDGESSPERGKGREEPELDATRGRTRQQTLGGHADCPGPRQRPTHLMGTGGTQAPAAPGM